MLRRTEDAGTNPKRGGGFPYRTREIIAGVAWAHGPVIPMAPWASPQAPPSLVQFWHLFQQAPAPKPDWLTQGAKAVIFYAQGDPGKYGAGKVLFRVAK